METTATSIEPNSQETLISDLNQAEAEAGNNKADDNALGDNGADQQIEYDDFETPEGITLDSDALSEFKTLAKEAGLKQEQAQAMTNIATKLFQKWAEDQKNSVESVKSGWEELSKNDKELGGEKLQENLALAKKGLDYVSTPELMAVLNETGIGNHPEIIRVFKKIEKLVADDKAFGGGRSHAKTRNSIAKSMYPDMND